MFVDLCLKQSIALRPIMRKTMIFKYEKIQIHGLYYYYK